MVSRKTTKSGRQIATRIVTGGNLRSGATETMVRKLLRVAKAVETFGADKTNQLIELGFYPRTLRLAARMVGENKCGQGNIIDTAKVWKLIHEKLVEKHLPDIEIEQLQLKFVELSAKTGNYLGMPNVLKAVGYRRAAKEGEKPIIYGFDILKDLGNLPFRTLAATRFSNDFETACNYVYSYHHLKASDKPGERPQRITVFRKLNGEEIIFASWLLSFNPKIFATIMQNSLRRFEGREIGIICAFAIAFGEDRTLAALKNSEKNDRRDFIRALVKAIEDQKPAVDSYYHGIINRLDFLAAKLK